MKWTKHITQTCSHANRALGFIKRNVKVRSPRIKEKLYNSLVRPHVEYASAVWSPHEVKPIHQLEMVQRRAARWTLNRHHNTSSVKGMLEDLQWRTLEQRRTDCTGFEIVPIRVSETCQNLSGHVKCPCMVIRWTCPFFATCN